MSHAECVNEVSKKAFIACAGFAAKAHSDAPSCAEAIEKGFGPGQCKYGCVGAGSCVSACKPGALKCEYGVITVDREKCDGCGDCIAACPQKLISLVPEDATNFIPCSNGEKEEETVRDVCAWGCIACGECVDNCPRGAVSLVDNHAVIDYSKCVGCVTCTVVCKKKIIVDTLHDLTEIKDHVAFVRCSGGKNKAKLADKGISNCAEAAKLQDKNGLCPSGCFGFGECEIVCRYDAIHVVDGVSVVDPAKCVGCGDCVHICPNGIISLVPYKGAKIVACSSKAPLEKKREVCDSACAGCGDCADNCPNGCITMDGELAVSDPAKCDNCNMCSYVCSRKVIREQAVCETVYLQHKALEETERGND